MTASEKPPMPEPYQERVLAELSELEARLDKLKHFLASQVFATLDGAEQERLERQADVMSQYAGILHLRILAWNSQPVQ